MSDDVQDWRAVLDGWREWAVVRGDCLDVLRELPAGSVDAVVTDPPYGERTHAGARSRTVGANSRALIDFAPITSAQLADYLRACLAISRRWVVSFCHWQHAAELESAGLPLVRLGVWVKTNPMPQLTGDRPGTGWESIAILHAPGAKRWNGRGRPAVWTCGTSRWGNFGPSNHPAEKPIPLLCQLLSDFTDTGELVLDPFAGSGTTGVACLHTGRRFIGVEIDPAYHAIAVERLTKAAAARQPMLPLALDG